MAPTVDPTSPEAHHEESMWADIARLNRSSLDLQKSVLSLANNMNDRLDRNSVVMQELKEMLIQLNENIGSLMGVSSANPDPAPKVGLSSANPDPAPKALEKAHNEGILVPSPLNTARSVVCVSQDPNKELIGGEVEDKLVRPLAEIVEYGVGAKSSDPAVHRSEIPSTSVLRSVGGLEADDPYMKQPRDRMNLSVKRYHKPRKKDLRPTIIPDYNALASSSKRSMGMNTIGMKRQSTWEKTATRRELLQALKSYGMIINSLGLRNYKELSQLRLERRSMVDKGVKRESHMFSYGLHSQNLHNIQTLQKHGAAEETKISGEVQATGNGIVVWEPGGLFTDHYKVLANELEGANAAADASMNEKDVCVAGQADRVWEPGGALYPTLQLSCLKKVGYAGLGKKSDVDIDAYVGVKLCKLAFKKQLVMIDDNGFKVQRLAKVHGSNAYFINTVFDPGGIQAECVTIRPDFEDQLWEHSNRLHVPYALHAQVVRAEDVLTHPRILKLAEGQVTRPVVEVFSLQLISLLGDHGLNIQEDHAFSIMIVSAADGWVDKVHRGEKWYKLTVRAGIGGLSSVLGIMIDDSRFVSSCYLHQHDHNSRDLKTSYLLMDEHGLVKVAYVVGGGLNFAGVGFVTNIAAGGVSNALKNVIKKFQGGIILKDHQRHCQH